MGVAAAVDLLERDDAGAALEAALAATVEGEGHLVFVSGDAGVGKSALVRAFRTGVSSRILAGSCDGLRTPRPLGPFVDMGFLGDTPREVFDELAADLRSSHAVMVVEDAHWADEATLDVLGLLARRIASVGALVVVTYRTDELSRMHPLRILLGDLATAPGVTRIRLEPLSAAAVAELAAPYDIDAADLYAKTAGNPFFVTEAIESGAGDVPATVRDAVLARAARLTPTARDLLDAVAVVPQQVDVWLLEVLARESVNALDECLASGMLQPAGNGVAFRHELARLTIEESIDPHRRARLHRRALDALREPPAGAPDLARLAHHADAAGDTAAVLEFAPAAAERAAAAGAHRESAAQFARALRYADRLSDGERARLLERRSFECYLTDYHEDAVESLEEAIGYYRAAGDVRKEGTATCSLAQRMWCAGDLESAVDAASRACTLLEPLGTDTELGRAFATRSSMAMNGERVGEAIEWGERALALLDPQEDVEIYAYELNNLGTAHLLAGNREGAEMLDRSIALATSAGLADHIGRGYIHLGWTASRLRDFELMRRMDEGIDYATDHGLELWRLYILTFKARSLLDQGRWAEAAEAVSFVDQPHRVPLLRTLALSVLGTVRVRRGDPEAWTALDEALEVAPADIGLQHCAPAAIGRTEAAAAAGDAALAKAASDEVLERALELHAGWVAGELLFWRRRAGIDEPVPDGIPEPFAAQLAGDVARARELWLDIGCPYEAALALVDAGDVESLRAALAELDALGAAPAAAVVTRQLRALGDRPVSRGPRQQTRENPAGLTARELEVLTLVTEGLRNADIAARLVLSERTVDHHVAAILRKLSVKTRTEASAEAARLGIAQVR